MYILIIRLEVSFASSTQIHIISVISVIGLGRKCQQKKKPIHCFEYQPIILKKSTFGTNMHAL